jgi:hypothetical protein
MANSGQISNIPTTIISRIGKDIDPRLRDAILSMQNNPNMAQAFANPMVASKIMDLIYNLNASLKSDYGKEVSTVDIIKNLNSYLS